MVYSHFTDFRDFEGVVSGAVRSGQLVLEQRGDKFWLTSTANRTKQQPPPPRNDPSSTLDMVVS